MSELRTTPERVSPYSLLQEEIHRDRPQNWQWRMMVVCKMLNLTSATQVRGIMDRFFDRFPGPEFVPGEEKIGPFDEMVTMLKPLGLQNRRARGISRMSEDFRKIVKGKPEKDWGSLPIDEVYGIGKYAADSWKIFVGRKVVTDVEDKELKNYVEWALSL